MSVSSSTITTGPLTHLIYNQSLLIDESRKHQANHGKNGVDLPGLSRGMCADEFAYVGAERRFDLVNGATLHQLPRSDGDTHKHEHKHTGPD